MYGVKVGTGTRPAAIPSANRVTGVRMLFWETLPVERRGILKHVRHTSCCLDAQSSTFLASAENMDARIARVDVATIEVDPTGSNAAARSRKGVENG